MQRHGPLLATLGAAAALASSGNSATAQDLEEAVRGEIDSLIAERTRTPLPSPHSSQFVPAPSLTLATGVTAMTAAVLELMNEKD